MYMTQMFRRAAQSNGAGLATIDEAGRRTWFETSERVQRLAGGLVSRGVREGERVAVLSLNSARLFESYFSIFWLGAVCVPLNTRWSFEELVYGLTDSAPVILLVDGSFARIAPDLKARCPSIHHIVLMTPDTNGPNH
jgi:long-chain acyl-CoA synthetase